MNEGQVIRVFFSCVCIDTVSTSLGFGFNRQPSIAVELPPPHNSSDRIAALFEATCVAPSTEYFLHPNSELSLKSCECS